jgi:23S rRNA (adenine2503-C2)-methyltransferase
MKKIQLPTGILFVDNYFKGKLETLSIGDYGKEHNIKADFLGRNKKINGVPNIKIKPLQEKWVVTLSTQYGCPMKCTFCDVPNVKFKGNATLKDLREQLYSALKMHDVSYTDRLNVHFARMGEPVLNPNVLEFARWLNDHKRELQENTSVRIETIHPVLSTMCPKNIKTFDYIWKWIYLKNDTYNGQAGLQISVNSTSEDQRTEMFRGKAYSLSEISEALNCVSEPLGRKYCLNIAYASGNEVDGKRLAKLFSPSKWMVKITPIHNNNSCSKNNIKTVGGYKTYTPYEIPEKSCTDAGFDTLVFVPSMDEEKSCITCGNAILGGSTIKL